MGALQDALNLVSTVAARGAQSLRGLQAAAQLAVAQVRVLGSIAAGPASRGLQAVQSGARSVGAGVVSMGSRVAGGITSLGKLGEGAQSLIGTLARIPGVATLAMGALNLGAAAAHYASDALSFKENAGFAFKYITGSQEKAGEMMAYADELARSLGAKTTDVGESLRELMSGGFDSKTAGAITSAIADVRAMNPAANVSAISTQIAQMKGAGRVLAEDLKPLLNAGVNDDIFYQVLREMTGNKDQASLKKALGAGKVDADTGIAAILETVKRQGGSKALGEVAAAKANSTVGGALENTSAMIQRSLMAINTGPIGARLIGLAQKAANLFDPAQESGKRFLGMLDRGVNLLLDITDGFDADTIVSGFNLVIDAGQGVLSFLEPLTEGFGQGFKEASSTVLEIVAVMRQGEGASSGFGNALNIVGQALGYVVVGIATTVAGLGWLVAQLAGVAAFVAAGAGAIGVAIVEGITSGLDSAKAGLISRLTALAELLPDTVRKLLKIQSPSRVMMPLGAYVTEGLTEGMGQGPQPQDRMREMMTPPSVPRPRLSPPQLAPGLAGAGAAGGQGRAIYVSQTNEITVHEAKDAQDLAEQLAPQFRRLTVKLWEELVLESGGALNG